MSKCNKCKYEYLSKIEEPCKYCRERFGECTPNYMMHEDKFEPKEEQSTIEHDGCMGCVYEDFEELEEPCVNCKGAYKHDTMAYLKAKDRYVPKDESADCTISCKECNKDFTNEDYGFKEISKDEIDMVNHPQHYNRDRAMECIDEMIAVFGKDIVACFCLCNVWKYRYRASYKGHEEDLSKSDYYMAKYKELITERSVLGFESVMEREELEDIVK